VETSAELLVTLKNKGPVGTASLRKTSEVSIGERSMSLLSSPFGPKTKSRLIPLKQFDQSPIQLDILENYQFWSDLGRGSYALVKFATNTKTGEKVAIKIYEKSKLEDPMLRKNLSREIKVLKRLTHPNIIQLLHEESKEKNHYLMLEYVQGHSLQALISKQPLKRLEEKEAVGIFTQFMRGLEYCHSLGVAHRDIKLENVLVGLDGVVKIIDFGFATFCKPGVKGCIYCGTPNYMAPEIVKKLEYEGIPVDVWAAGVLLYLLVTGIFPFGSNKEEKVFKRILKLDLQLPEFLTGECKDLICCLLQPCPEKRINARKCLLHPWIVARGKVIVKNLQNFGDDEDVGVEEDV
jgi:MAP/microtubule affinity-regulating kinase